jgi:hypothetical protein
MASVRIRRSDPEQPAQTTHKLLRQELRGVLLAALESPSVASVIGSTGCRACAALYALLLEHPVDERGRCRLCRRLDSVVGRRRRRCQVYPVVRGWLHRPDQALVPALAGELGLRSTHPRRPPVPPDRSGPRVVDRADPGDTGGDHPGRHSRPRRDPSPGPYGSLIRVGDVAWGR